MSFFLIKSIITTFGIILFGSEGYTCKVIKFKFRVKTRSFNVKICISITHSQFTHFSLTNCGALCCGTRRTPLRNQIKNFNKNVSNKIGFLWIFFNFPLFLVINKLLFFFDFILFNLKFRLRIFAYAKVYYNHEYIIIF